MGAESRAAPVTEEVIEWTCSGHSRARFNLVGNGRTNWLFIRRLFFSFFGGNFYEGR